MSSPPVEQIKAGNRTVSLPTGLFINGNFTYAKSRGTFPSENPSTGATIVSVQEGLEEDVDIAVSAARACYESDEWQNMPAPARGALLHKLADLYDEHAEDIIALEMMDTGKTYAQASKLDHPGSASTLRYYAGFADKLEGTTSFNIPGVFGYTRKEAIGVCGQIIPWNFPLLMFTWKIAPAITCGNTVVIKSAETTPLTALYIASLIQKAGFPPGCINLVSGYGKTVGSAIAHHMDIDKLAFTGSTATGRSILRASAASNLKKVTLELGGKSPNIIFPDADLDQAVEWAAWGINMNFGQTCHAGTRIYVHEEIYEQFLERFVARMGRAKVGDNFGTETTQGPQNSKLQFEKIMGYIEEGRKEGATVALGGKAISGEGGKGYFVEPTVFTDVTPEMKIVKEEIFGPVVTVAKFANEKEVIKAANNTTYGLAAAVHTKDYQRAVRVTNALKAGTTWVNMFNFVHCSMPFGGYKESGIGKECGTAALETYTETKTVYYNMGIDAPQM